MSVQLLMSIDPSFDPESVHCPSEQQYGGSSDPRQGQSASCATVPSELDSAVREGFVGPGDSHHQGKYTPIEQQDFKKRQFRQCCPKPRSATQHLRRDTALHTGRCISPMGILEEERR